MQRNIAEREADITHHAYHDSLTGLPNRALAREATRSMLVGRRSATPFALILIDMRNVREINASLGHHVGDDVLREAARRLRAERHRRTISSRASARLSFC